MSNNSWFVFIEQDVSTLLSHDLLQTGYYLPDAEVVRERYRVLTPPLDNLNPYGYYIWKECRRYQTYRLVREGEPFGKCDGSAYVKNGM